MVDISPPGINQSWGVTTRASGVTALISVFAYAVMILGLALAAWSGIESYLRKPASGQAIIAAAVLEVILLIQSVISILKMIGGAQVAEPVTFYAYLGGVLLPLPLGIYLARIERTRWGSLSLCFTAVVVAVMMLRLLQLWRMGNVNA